MIALSGQHVNKLSEILFPAGIFLITLICGFLVRKVMFMRLSCWSKNTKTQVDDIIIESIKGPFIIWFLMLGIYFTLECSRLPENLIHIIDKLLLALGILSITFVLANISARLVSAYSNKVQNALPVTSLTQNISRLVVFTVGIPVLLHSLGISVVPILTAFLFSGFYIVVSRQIKLGDYIKLDTGEEGYVTDITWRATKIKQLPRR